MDLMTKEVDKTPAANSTLLPFLLLTIATQKFFPETKSCFKKEYDYIIVGAGSAGSVLAGRLSEIPYINVLLLEAGGNPTFISEVPGYVSYIIDANDWGLNTVPQKHCAKLIKDNKLRTVMGKVVGGSSVVNYMAMIRGNHYNYDGWEKGGASGWGYRDVLPYFKKLESMQVPEYFNTEYHGFSGPITAQKPSYDPKLKHALTKALKGLGYDFVDSNGANQYGIFDFPTSTRGGRRCSTAKAYLVPADHRNNLDIVSNAFVRKIVTENKRAIGVEFEHGGLTHFVRANEEVIVSAGTVHTPQILMLSGIGPKKELQKFQIPMVANLPVGKNFHDNYDVPLAFEITKKIPTLDEDLGNNEHILQFIINGTGALTSLQGTMYLGFLSNATPGSSNPDFQIYLQQVFAAENFVDPKLVKGKNLAGCLVNTLQPKSRGTITLNSTDPHDPPLIDPNYLSNQEDVDITVEGLQVCLRIFRSPHLKQIGAKHIPLLDKGCKHYLGHNEKKYLQCLVRNYGTAFFHYAGTAKMGRIDDPTTVVCPELKVKGIQGLRVADGSIMPEVTSGNTNIPIIMIAEKASDMIKKDWFAKRSNY